MTAPGGGDNPWKDGADRILELAERFLRPMVEEAEERRKKAKAIQELMGDDPPAPFPGVLGDFTLAGLAPAELPKRVVGSFVWRGTPCVILDDGGMWYLGTDEEDEDHWYELPEIPGTARALAADREARSREASPPAADASHDDATGSVGSGG